MICPIYGEFIRLIIIDIFNMNVKKRIHWYFRVVPQWTLCTVCSLDNAIYSVALLTELDYVCAECFDAIQDIYDLETTKLHDTNFATYCIFLRQSVDVAHYAFQFLPFVSGVRFG
jgi:hypothetical protein